MYYIDKIELKSIREPFPKSIPNVEVQGESLRDAEVILLRDSTFGIGEVHLAASRFFLRFFGFRGIILGKKKG